MAKKKVSKALKLAKEEKSGLEAAKNAYRGGSKTMQWTEEGREIVRKMRATKKDYSGTYFVGEGDIAKVRKLISKWDTYGGYGTHDILVGEIVIITSAPYNPWGDGLRVDVLHGAESIQGVKLAKLIKIRQAEDEE